MMTELKNERFDEMSKSTSDHSGLVLLKIVYVPTQSIMTNELRNFEFSFMVL